MSTAQPNTAPSRLPGLDILRFWAIFLVICHHVTFHGSPDALSYKILKPLSIGGWTGVDLFFVLSGFLVSGLLFAEFKTRGTVNLGRFLLRRGWRIYPPFWVMILCSILLYDFHVWDGFNRRGLFGEILFLQNYLGGFWGPTWSLAVEEHFYLTLALIFFVLRLFAGHVRNLFAAIPWMFLATAAACLVLRFVYAQKHHDEDAIVTLAHQSQFRMDSLMFGVLISWWWHMKSTGAAREFIARHALYFVLAGMVCFVPAFVWNSHQTPWIAVYGVILFYLGGGFMVLGVIGKAQPNRVNVWLARLGKYSYSVYLWNGIVYELLITWLRSWMGPSWNNWLEFFACFVLTWTIGIAAAKLFEEPLLKLRQKLTP